MSKREGEVREALLGGNDRRKTSSGLGSDDAFADGVKNHFSGAVEV
jgi:hypothetical protein